MLHLKNPETNSTTVSTISTIQAESTTIQPEISACFE